MSNLHTPLNPLLRNVRRAARKAGGATERKLKERAKVPGVPVENQRP